MSWLRCRLGFSLLHSAIMCIRGSRSSSGHPFKGHVPASVDLALGEGRLIIIIIIVTEQTAQLICSGKKKSNHKMNLAT